MEESKLSKEFWAIITVGVGLGGLMVALGTLMVISLGSIDSRLDSMETHFNARFDSVETRIDSMETHFNARLDTMETHFNARFDSVEARLTAMDARLTAMEARMHDLNTRVGRIEGRLDIFTDPALE